MKSPGQKAYEAYFAYSEGKSLVSRANLPTWENQHKCIQEAWEVAVKAAMKLEAASSAATEMTEASADAIKVGE